MWYCILTLQIAYIALDSPFHKAGVLMVEDEASRIEKITCSEDTRGNRCWNPELQTNCYRCPVQEGQVAPKLEGDQYPVRR